MQSQDERGDLGRAASLGASHDGQACADRQRRAKGFQAGRTDGTRGLRAGRVAFSHDSYVVDVSR